MSCKRYRYYTPFRHYRIRTGLCNILITLFVWSILFTVDFIKFAIKMDINIYRWIKNTIHYRKIDYNYNQMRMMIKRMSPREFEIFCAELYKAMGYDSELTPPSNDMGRDVILRDDEGNMIYVEAKHYDEENGLMIGREILQKLIGAMVHDGANYGIIFTTGKIHRNAIDYMRSLNNIEIIDFKDIMDMLYNIDAEDIPRIFSKTFNFEVVKDIWQLDEQY